MTIAQLEQSMDHRFRKVDRRFREIRREIDQLRQEVTESAAETRRHFDVVAESLHDDLRIFAEAITRHTERLDQHEVRIDRLERRTL